MNVELYCAKFFDREFGYSIEITTRLKWVQFAIVTSCLGGCEPLDYEIVALDVHIFCRFNSFPYDKLR